MTPRKVPFSNGFALPAKQAPSPAPWGPASPAKEINTEKHCGCLYSLFCSPLSDPLCPPTFGGGYQPGVLWGFLEASRRDTSACSWGRCCLLWAFSIQLQLWAVAGIELRQVAWGLGVESLGLYGVGDRKEWGLGGLGSPKRPPGLGSRDGGLARKGWRCPNDTDMISKSISGWGSPSLCCQPGTICLEVPFEGSGFTWRWANLRPPLSPSLGFPHL